MKNGKHKAQVLAKLSHKSSKAVASIKTSNSADAKFQWLRPNNKDEAILSNDNDQAWYTMVPSFSTDPNQVSNIESVELERIRNKVQLLFTAEVERYHDVKRGTGGSDQKWMNDVIKAGTISDRVAALALVVQESPHQNLAALDNLINLASKKEQRTALLALEALKDLLIHNLLPDRRLVPFNTRQWQHSDMTMQIALNFWFEDQLISRVARVVDVIENGHKSTIEYFKKQCMSIAADLLINKPEQEARLLGCLVNKLGDPSKAICSKTIELLKKVIWAHPAMKIVVVREVRQFIYRPSLPMRAIYLGIIFLNQVDLRQSDHDTASQLVECYVSLFEKAVKEDHMGSSLLSALLSGINRAFPVLRDTKSLWKYTDALFRLVHESAFATATQALTLISHIAIGTTLPSTQVGGAGNSKRDGKKGKAKAPKKAEGGEEDGRGGDNTEGNDGTTVSTKSPASDNVDLVNRFYRALYSKLLSDEVATRTRNTLFFNLLFRSIKGDPSISRAMTFVKRLCMMSLQSQAPIAAGIIMLISEVCRTRPQLGVMMTQLNETAPAARGAGAETTGHPNGAKGGNRGSHGGDGDDGDEDGADEARLASVFGSFDAAKREPLYALSTAPGAGAGTSVAPDLWEAALLRQHFHPSVQAFASSLSQPPHTIAFDGDPTVQFSVISFLNRFAYKNPKKIPNDGKVKRAQATPEDPVNDSVFIERDIRDVDPDKMFFHRYFGEREALRAVGKSRDRTRKTKKKREGLDDPQGGEDPLLALGDGDDDDEEEMDAFANQLAEDMITRNDKDAEVGDDDGFDDDDDDDDDDGTGVFRGDDDFQDGEDGDDDEGDEDEGGLFDADDADDADDAEDENGVLDFDDYLAQHEAKAKAKAKGGKGAKGDAKGLGDRKAVGDTKKNKKKRKAAVDDDDDDDGSYELMAFGDDDDDGSIPFQQQTKGAKGAKGAKGVKGVKGMKKPRGDDMSDFADAADYEEEMEAIIQAHIKKHGSIDGSGSGAGRGLGSAGRKGGGSGGAQKGAQKGARASKRSK